MTNSMYAPNPQGMVLNQMQFISLSSRAAAFTPVLDYDQIFEEVSSEIMTLFVADEVESAVSHHLGFTVGLPAISGM